MTIGLSGFRDEKALTLRAMLILPFRRVGAGEGGKAGRDRSSGGGPPDKI
jgi:hypothetical protein